MFSTDWREEIKIPFVGDWVKVHSELAALGYMEAFPDRVVHSLYLDTQDLGLLRTAQSDLPNRFFLRIRSYNDSQESVLECKQRRGNSNRKLRHMGIHKLPLQLPEVFLQTLGKVPALYFPFLQVIYSRSYLQHPAYPGWMVTLDRDIRCESEPSRQLVKLPQAVLEMKRGFSVSSTPSLPESLQPPCGHSKYRLAAEALQIFC